MASRVWFAVQAALVWFVCIAAAAPGSLTGRVQTPDGQPIAGVTVSVDGAVRATATTNGAGTFTFARLTPGTYVVRAAKAGFDRLERDDVLVASGDTVSVSATLTPASFSSLQTIGRVSSSAPGKISINTGTAALDVIPGSAFADQGSLQVTKLLEETPGVSLTSVTAGGGANRASFGAPVYPQLRGSLYYETESLIDGHPVSVGAIGTFSPVLILPALLQSTEVVKGPGAMPVEINYAIGGTVNYRTLEPTREAQFSFDAGADRYGGVNTALTATGPFGNGRIDYAFAYATVGTPGPLQNYPVATSQVDLAFGLPPYTVNGLQVPGSPVHLGPSPTPWFVGGPGTSRFTEPLYLCCSPVNTGFNARAELGKLRFNFSQQTTLTVSYLGGQGGLDYTGTILASSTPVINFSYFAPPAGYSGSIAPGTPIPFDTQATSNDSEFLQQNLFQAELRSTLGNATLLARLYSGFDNTFVNAYNPGQPLVLTENGWGGIALCPAGSTAKGAGCVGAGGAAVAPVTTFFNGQPVTLVTNNVASYTQLLDNVRGYSVEADQPVGTSVLSLAFDQSNHSSYEYSFAPGNVGVQTVLPPGSGQQFTTLLARAQMSLTQRLTATLATYYTLYASHYTGNGGVTWSNATHSNVLPRLAFSWRPESDVAWRLALGGSIAPPYISLLSSPGTTPVHDPAGAAQGYFINANNGAIAPETAFGVDLGADFRLRPTLKASGDIYYTHLSNLFLTETSQQGTFAATTGPSAGIAEPLYVTQTANLGNARYQGIEFQLESAPRAGFGFRLQGSLQRAFTYGLAPSFYTTTAGPYTTNLGIVPNVNFQASGNGFNAVSPGRIPYSQGYAEVNFRDGRASQILAGWTYNGPNNGYNQPAFGVLSASVRIALSNVTYVQLSADNLTNQYAQPYAALASSVPVALINGKLGIVAGSNYGPTTLQFTLHHTFR